MPEPHATESEIWRPIPITEGWYEASTFGRVRCAITHVFVGGVLRETIAPRIIKARPNCRTGYPSVAVRKNPREPMTCSVHRLVADAFLGPRPCGADINHIDGARTNNRPDNLEYVTRSQNHFHAYRTLGRNPSALAERAAKGFWKRKISDTQVSEIRTRYAAGGITQAALAKEYGVCHTYICVLVKGRNR